jgi:asparagine synthase (glutamine-hydrolysing)
MCGICGIWYFDRNRRVDPALLGAMTDQIIHRGPDEGGQHIDGSIGLGFRRLSIIDVGGSHQPMANEDKRIWLTFNGEIYNFHTLRDQLTATHNFRTAGDTETIIHAYEDYGPRCVDYFRGMFALAIWDGHADRLTLAVDRFGKKPIYYLVDDEKALWGSELKTILQHPGVSREIDQEALDEYLAYGYINAPRSIFNNIRKLAPGHVLTITRDGRIHPEQYWHPYLCEPEQHSERSLDDLADELRGLLVDAVRLRMISDVPLGAFLSGGVDSSAVVGLMSHISTQPVKTFSIGFDEAFYDETGYAQIVAEYCNTDHVREVVRPDVVGILPKLIRQYDEPFADASMIPTYYVSQAARQHVTVALSGDGGDEVFGGYQWYRYGARHEFLQSLIPASLRPLVEHVGRVVPKVTRLRHYLSVVNQPAHYWGTYTGFFDPVRRGQLYTSDAAAALGGYTGERLKKEAFQRAERLDGLTQLQYSDLTVYMPGDILVKVDRASMLASLEVRCPLLDHVVFEFMAQVPSQYKLNIRDSKILLKKAVGSLLPPAIHTRPKQGFGIPQGEWLAEPLQPLLRDTLLSARARNRGLFDPTFVSILVDEHVGGQADHKERLWALLCFELWAQMYLDN